jgi:hypothetical protein
MHGGFDEGDTLQVATNKLVPMRTLALNRRFATPARAPNSFVIPSNYCTNRCPIYIYQTGLHSA